FDPHKAGTVREIHTSLRDTLPSRTFEDRVLFVLNRIDECASMIDLLRVYGTLCWNLSQITGRKDIPMIHLTYSTQEASAHKDEHDISYLRYLENQREELKRAVLLAPRYRLDNLAAFVETHGERLSHLLEALISFRRRARGFNLKSSVAAIGVSLLAGAAAFALSMAAPPMASLGPMITLGIAGAAALVFLAGWALVLHRFFFDRFLKKTLKNIAQLTPLQTQTRRDSWESVRELVVGYLRNTNGKFSLREARREYGAVWKIYERGSKEIREALKELENLPEDEELEFTQGQLRLVGDSRRKEPPA
ncbi:MAG: Dynamin family protein, partial [Desulfatitalea sp.]|nr:Dynamin family protein [Desulfatitalea sp.]